MTAHREPHLYAFLNGLRGIAAILVVQRHAASTFGGIPFESSYLAVDFFFALSGFVIAHANDSRLKVNMTLRDFVKRRVIRLYPMYTIAVLLAAAYYHTVQADYSYATLFLSIFFLPNLLVPQPFLVASAWSLFCELVVNFIYAGSTKSRFGSAINCAAMAIGMVGVVACAIMYGTLDVGFRSSDVWGGVARALFGFFAGVTVYRYGGLWRTAPRALAIGLSASLLTLLILTISPVFRPFYDIIVLLLAPFAVLAGSLVKLPSKCVSMCEVLGEISYPLYIIHLPAVLLTSYVVTTYYHKPSGDVMWVLIWSFILACSAACWFLGEFIDKPFRQRLNEALRQRSSPAVDLR